MSFTFKESVKLGFGIGVGMLLLTSVVNIVAWLGMVLLKGMSTGMTTTFLG